jgi:hypothetical protein
MKKTLLLSACLCLSQILTAQTAGDFDASLNALIRPFLDSLRVDPSEEEMNAFRLVSVFPASRAADPRFDDFSDAGILRSFPPENDKLTGRVTAPIALLGGTRLATIYALTAESYSDLANDVIA